VGLLDDAIRDHLQLKRAHGADEAEVRRLEQEALGPARSSGEFAAQDPQAPEPPAAPVEPQEPPEAPAPDAPEQFAAAPGVADPVPEFTVPAPAPYEEPAGPAAPAGDAIAARPARAEPEPWLDEPDEVPAEERLEPRAGGEEDVLEETPEFLQETPEHDRLWFEQKPPRDFDFDQ
jgi:hypothetical protein